MQRTHSLILAAGVATVLGACASTPKSNAELDTARAVVAQVEASPRAGVAAQNIAEARKSLDRANKLATENGKPEDIKFEANVAAMNAQIANEKILTAQAQEEIQKGTADRQAVLLEAREREAQLRGRQADTARMEADAAKQHASSLEDELKALQAKPTERGMVLTLGDVLFDTGQATLKPGAYATIDRLGQALQASPDRKVIIEGHTDSVGTDEFNQQLSERRAMAVQSALMQRGVSSGQISSAGKGESFPVASNDNAAGRQQNRRVEMIFSNEQQQPARTASDGT
jgi:outer membrane protein OmpA-like peptidoglycan-associated protein